VAHRVELHCNWNSSHALWFDGVPKISCPELFVLSGLEMLVEKAGDNRT
jgi:hypothetical protein